MRTKQLNVWIPEDLRDYVARRADDEKHPMNAIIADLIRDDIVKRNEQLTEQTTLIVLQEWLQQSFAQKCARPMLSYATNYVRTGNGKLSCFLSVSEAIWTDGRLLVAAVRSSGIARRLLYTLLSKDHGARFAKAVYDDAREKVCSRTLYPGRRRFRTSLPRKKQCGEYNLTWF